MKTTDSFSAVHCKSKDDISRLLFPTSHLNASQCISLGKHGGPQQKVVRTASLWTSQATTAAELTDQGTVRRSRLVPHAHKDFNQAFIDLFEMKMATTELLQHVSQHKGESNEKVKGNCLLCSCHTAEMSTVSVNLGLV